MTQDQHKPQTSEDRPVVIGIDWADGKHDVCVIEDGSPDLGPAQFSELRQHPDAIADFIADLRGRFPGRPLQVVIEQSRGALVNALLAIKLDVQLLLQVLRVIHGCHLQLKHVIQA